MSDRRPAADESLLLLRQAHGRILDAVARAGLDPDAWGSVADPSRCTRAARLEAVQDLRRAAARLEHDVWQAER